MKIAFYYKSANNGIKTHVDALSYEFEKSGHEVKRIDQLLLGSYMLGNVRGGLSYGFDFALGKIKKEVEDCDILHIHHAATFSEFFLPFSTIFAELSIVNTFHIAAASSLEGELRKIHIAALTSLYSGRSKKFISVSAEIAEYIRRYCYGYGTSGNNGNGTQIVVIPNGVDTNRFHPAEKEGKDKERDEDETCICIGYLGRLSPEKNIINLIKAVRALESENIRLKIAGSGPLYNRVKKMENELVQVLGYVEDAASFYQSLDVFVLPSKLEAQPIVLLEAMASGLPIIATDVGDNKYFVRRNGIICGASVKEIGAAIQEMLHADREKMGKQSRRMVEQSYTWDKIAARTLEVYKT